MTEKSLMVLDYKDPALLKTIKDTVAKDTTDSEFALFIGRCATSGLNPLNNEIWCIKSKGYTDKSGRQVEGRLQIMTGINGFFRLANENQQFNGLTCEVERDKEGRPIRAIAKCYRKDREFPSIGEAIWSEDAQPVVTHNGKPTIWGQRPSVMLAKVAKGRALREAFPHDLNGLDIPESVEAGNEQESDPPIKAEIVETKPAPQQAAQAALLKAFPGSTTEETKRFFYATDALPLNKVEATNKWLERAGAVYNDEYQAWVSEKEIKAAAKLLLTPSEAEQRQVFDLNFKQDSPAWMGDPASGDNQEKEVA